jgi:quinoprotein glucose dehydrogenase
MTWFNRLLTTLLLLVGLGLVWIGGELLLAGGSLYYSACGLALIVSAGLLWQQSARALYVYAAIWTVSLVWSVWEAGLAFWPLFGRMAMLTAIGIWLLTPWVRRSLKVTPVTRISGGLLGMAVLGLVAGLSWTFWNDRIVGGTDLAGLAGAPPSARDGEWRHYGNLQAGQRYSPLGQITPANVGALQEIWRHSTGREPNGQPAPFQATPLMVGDRLYFCTGYNDVIALDPESGKQIWRFEAHADTTGVFGQTCRGVTYFAVPDAVFDESCAARIYTATIDSRLIALDAQSGRPCAGFGKGGEVDLLRGMSKAPPGYYHVSSPPTLVSGKLVIGGWVTDGQMVGEPSGVIRAYDAVTGELAWAWDMGAPDRMGEPAPGETYTPGTPNSWSVMSADEELGMVYVPLGNATPDYTGLHRTPEMETYSTSVVALDAETGRPRWHFQTAHHDTWDYDVASQPVLLDLPDGRPALLQPTKRGELFMLDRRTGKPIAKVAELPVAASRAEGGQAWSTQPFSVGLPSFEGPRPSERSMWGMALVDQAWCRLKFRQARFEGHMTPIETDRASIIWPGSLGGNNWGSIAVDPVQGIAFVNSSHVLNYNRLIARNEADRMGLKPVAVPSYENVAGPVAQAGTPYAAAVAPFLSPLVAPCTEPPYGLVSAVDLVSGKLLWQKPFGTARDSGPLMMPLGIPIPMGVPNIGGAVVTGSGLAFIGATQEHMIRAYELRSGKELWHGRLPAGGNATPMTYWSGRSGRQFVVIAAGGHGGILSGYSNELIAYALPHGVGTTGEKQ